MIHVCDKLPNAGSRFMDVLIVVEMNFFLLEGIALIMSEAVVRCIPIQVLTPQPVKQATGLGGNTKKADMLKIAEGHQGYF